MTTRHPRKPLPPIYYHDIYTETDDALTEWLSNDLRRARWLLSMHFDVGGGWCHHQGANRSRYRFPCRLYSCARHALIQCSIPTQREVSSGAAGTPLST